MCYGVLHPDGVGLILTAVAIRIDRASDESPLVPVFQTCQGAVSFAAMCE